MIEGTKPTPSGTQMTANPHQSFICSKCNMNYLEEPELIRHFSQDWHKYNVKRSMVSLGPVTEEVFKNKIEAALRQMENPEDKKKLLKEDNTYCEACHKKFSNPGTFKHHFQSAAHKKAQKEFEKNGGVLEPQEKKKKEIKTTLESIGVCLFCNYEAENLEKSMEHMQRAHNFFLPDPNNIVDLEKIILYLAGKVHKGLMCIYCDNLGCKDFKNGSAVQGHMRDKIHFTINTENMEEYYKFYAYEENKTLGRSEKARGKQEEEAEEEKDVESGEKEMEIEMDKPEIKEEEDWEDEEDDDDWEDEEDESQDDANEAPEEKEEREKRKREILKQFPHPKVYSKHYRQKKMEEIQLEVLPSGELMVKGKRYQSQNPASYWSIVFSV